MCLFELLPEAPEFALPNSRAQSAGGALNFRELDEKADACDVGPIRRYETCKSLSIRKRNVYNTLKTCKVLSLEISSTSETSPRSASGPKVLHMTYVCECLRKSEAEGWTKFHGKMFMYRSWT